jgi:hypothetical protein
LLKSAEGYTEEEPVASAFGADMRSFHIEDEENDIPYYKQHFVGKDHINIIVTDDSLGPMVISAIKHDETEDAYLFKTVSRSKKGATRKIVEVKTKKKAPPPREIAQAVDINLGTNGKNLRQIKGSGLIKELENFESRQVRYLTHTITDCLSSLKDTNLVCCTVHLEQKTRTKCLPTVTSMTIQI